ncbi:MAG: hypothetical protein KDD78_14840 [Caldilineaceae bacterium]|nr:hypothetical protein [Caldilineaceae bacterium]
MSHWLMQSEPVTLWQVVQGFFAQDFDLLLAYLHAPNGDAIAIWIVILAGFSESVGQSVILFANRVRQWRFVISLLMSALLYLVSFFVWTGIVLAATSMVTEIDLAWQQTARIVALSYIPLFFGFLWLIPYAGNPIIILLYLWTFGVLTTLLKELTNIPFWNSFLIALLGLLLILLLRATIGKPLRSLTSRMLDLAAGTRLEPDLRRALGDAPVGPEQGKGQA